MTANITDEEFDRVTGLSSDERYAYFVRRVRSTTEVWALRATDGFVIMADEFEQEYIPVWPAARFAAAYASPGEEPELIPLEAWMARWLPGLGRDNSGVAVFPVEGDSGAVIPLDELREDLSGSPHDQ